MDVDDKRVNDYLELSPVRKKAEILRHEYVRRRRTEETHAEARRILAAFQGVFRWLSEHGKEVENVEYVFGKFDASLRYHLEVDYAGLYEALDEQNKRDIVSAASIFERLALRPMIVGKPLGVISHDPREKVRLGESSQSSPQAGNINGIVGQSTAGIPRKCSVFG
jgi:hypothetical protein